MSSLIKTRIFFLFEGNQDEKDTFNLRYIHQLKEKDLYKEKIIYLDGVWNSHSGLNIERKYNKLPSQNGDIFTLGSFNNFSKISDDTVMAWSEILKKIKSSRPSPLEKYNSG